MTEFVYEAEVNRMLLCVRVLADVNLDGILDAVNSAHQVGWFLDPTAYTEALNRGDMQAIADIAKALQPVREAFNEKVRPKMKGALA